MKERFQSEIKNWSIFYYRKSQVVRILFFIRIVLFFADGTKKGKIIIY